MHSVRVLCCSGDSAACPYSAMACWLDPCSINHASATASLPIGRKYSHRMSDECLVIYERHVEATLSKAAPPEHLPRTIPSFHTLLQFVRR